MLSSPELPVCIYAEPPILIPPSSSTPNETLYLSNLDDQKFLRFSIKYLYLFKKSVSIDILKKSLSRILVDYYPLAGRLRKSRQDDEDDDHKLEVECNGEGAVFVEAFMDLCADEFLRFSDKPNRSWRKLLYRVEAQSFLDIAPLVVQVTNLRCGGMILCTAISHCLCDGIGTSQFLHAWAHITTNHTGKLPITPSHSRHVLKPQQINYEITLTNPGFTKNTLFNNDIISQHFRSQPLVPSSLTFTASHVSHLKRQCSPMLKCTTFEIVASHTWRAWVKSLDLSPALHVKLLFSVNIRKRLEPEMPQGYYGNGFVLACAETTVKELVSANLNNAVKLVQRAKACVTDEYARSVVNILEDKTVKTDLSASLVISQWSKLGLEDVDFGQGKPLHMGPITADIYCLFLPVIGDFHAVRVLVSMPESVVNKFEYYMNAFSGWEVNEEADANKRLESQEFT
ncbi:hypothetical protein DCAR_0520093 [Daucus carota subsp. sativus]|uniref:Uncharacterized protein n=1 Tax=Daucus carota subsp. sativus TaxID=79200 RepID=A0A175Y953_DAUCS|nr:PREDICTED: omega-hydroxypalmitate O-feruloyl transferase [Daucus carota subsp. sativus]WOH00719.1 hypothetical protein DCAR_0520093 [Daucus carota subsp. sativus]